MATTSATAPPSGVYSKYKRATQFFLDWLLRAHTHGCEDASTTAARAASPRDMTLDAFHGVVDAIARAPAAQLSPALLHQLPRALAACQVAITLRERVTQFFASAGAADDAHAHFLSRLKTWCATLQRVAVDSKPSEANKPKGQKTKKKAKRTPTNVGGDSEDNRDSVADPVQFTNYYDVLRLPDDYFDEDQTSIEEEMKALDSNAGPMHRSVSDADRKKLYAEAFQEDLEMELICFLMELEDMADQVYQTYVEVKHEKRTILDATAVVCAATLLTQSRAAALQLRYPSIRTAEDILTLLQHRMSKDLTYKMADTLARKIQERESFHIPGFFLVDYTWVLSALVTFTSAIPSDPTQTVILRDGHFGANYDEEFTPHYMLPDVSTVSPFFMQQLPLLYNLRLGQRQRGEALHDDSLPDGFLKLMDEYFVTKTVGVPLVFVCICWVKSVVALQGAGTLKRHASLAGAHTREIERRLRASVEKGHVLKADREIDTVMKHMLSEVTFRRAVVSQGHVGRRLLQSNPILTGYMMLHDHIRFLHLGGESVLVTSRLRAFLHLYCALVDRGLLETIPFIEELVAVYGAVMFTPSRSAAVHGSYCRTYLLSSHMTAAGVDALFRGSPQPARQAANRVRDCYHLSDLSSTYRLVVNRDLSSLAPAHESLSLKDQLLRVANQCANDTLRSRVLSRDLLKLNDDLTDLFESLCDGLGRRWYHDEYLAGQEPGLSRQYMVNRALEDAVMVPLMPFLDCLNADGSADPSRLLRMDSVRLSRVSDDSIAQYCQRAARVIRRRFSSEPERVAAIEASYFLLRTYTDGFSREFGSRDFKSNVSNPSREEHFCELMDLLEDTPGPLTEEDIRNLKKKIRDDPELLLMVSVTSELATILHLVAAGPGYDLGLVDWLIQMGGLYWQPAGHFRSDRGISSMQSARINQLAVHSAAAAGHMEIVLLLLEADNMRDLNTPTYHTRECLVHLAVRNGHRNLYRILVTLGADVRGRTRDGKRLSDLTNDREWKREILEKTVQQERMHSASHQQNREGLFRHVHEQNAESVRRSVARQRDQEFAVGGRGATTMSSSSAASSRGGSVKKKGKKNQIRNRDKAVERSPVEADGGAVTGQVHTQPAVSETETATSLLHDLHVSSPTLPAGVVEELDRELASFEQSKAVLADAFAKLKHVADPPTDEQEAAAASAVAILDRVQQIVGYTRRPDRLNATPRDVRLQFATSAYDAIHLMNKLDRSAHTKAAVLPLAAGATSVETLRHMCQMQDFFIGFIAGTAQLLTSLGRMSQARELFDVGEKRLLKLEERPPTDFRRWVQHYTETREACGLGKSRHAL